MLEMLGIIAGIGLCFPIYMGLHNAVEYGRREGIVAKKDRDEHGNAVAVNKTME